MNKINNLVIGTLVYNEEHKFLKKYLNKISQLTDKLVFIDDGSTDNSLSICKQYSQSVFVSDGLFKINESILRQNLWQKCAELCDKNDYILILDCDELLPQSSIDNFEKFLKINDELGGDGIGFNLYDMWNETQYREEPPYWVASLRSNPRCIKYKKNYKYYWNNRKIHCGPFPINAYFSILPTCLQIQHMAYTTPELREKKLEFYKTYDKQPDNFLINQYNSICAENPILKDFKDSFIDYDEQFEYWKVK